MTTLTGSRIAVAQRQQESEEKYALAKDFFTVQPPHLATKAAVASPNPTTAPDPTKSPDSPVATDQGAVQFHLIGHKPEDPKYSAMMQEGSDNLLAIGGLIFNYMKSHHSPVDTTTMNINTWLPVINHIPDLAVGNQVNKTYQNRLRGVSVSGEFLSMIAKAIITDGASLLSDFQSFLSSVGGVALTASKNSEKYNILTCTYLNYLVDDQAGGYYNYGAIALKQITFNEYFQQLKTSCASEEYVNIDMTYTEAVSLVQLGRIREGGPDHDKFQDLIKNNSSADFAAADNFFNSPSNDPSKVKPT